MVFGRSRAPESTLQLFKRGHCKSWTLDSGLDRGLDCGLYYGLIFGLDSGPSSASVTTISYRAYRVIVKAGLWTLDWTVDWTVDCTMD